MTDKNPLNYLVSSLDRRTQTNKMSANIPNSKAKKILIDTDMSMDVDDVTAIVLAHQLMTIGECNLVAIIHNTATDLGPAAILSINRYVSW